MEPNTENQNQTMNLPEQPGVAGAAPVVDPMTQAAAQPGAAPAQMVQSGVDPAQMAQPAPAAAPMAGPAAASAVAAQPGAAPAQSAQAAQNQMQMTAGMSGYQQDKKARGMLVGLIVAIIVAVVGVAAGVGMGVASGQAGAEYETKIAKLEKDIKESEDLAVIETKDEETGEVVVETVKVLDNLVAQNLVNPYLRTFTFLNNVFDHGLDDEARFYLAFANLTESDFVYYNSSEGVDGLVGYDVINAKYKYMFGSDTDIAKQDYSVGYYQFKFTDDRFEFTLYGGGGAGLAMMNVVKDAYYNDESVTVEMYHDALPYCGADENNGYCFADGMDVVSNLVTDDGAADFIDDFSDRIPVYKMTFAENEGHYVLKNIVKM